METWFQDEINQLVKEGKKITSIRVFHSNGRFTDIYPPLLPERQKVCDEIIEEMNKKWGTSVVWESIRDDVKQIRDK